MNAILSAFSYVMLAAAVVVALGGISSESPALAADAGTCYTIGDADARTFCLAKAHGEPGMCYAIQRPDLRGQCLAEVRK